MFGLFCEAAATLRKRLSQHTHLVPRVLVQGKCEPTILYLFLCRVVRNYT